MIKSSRLHLLWRYTFIPFLFHVEREPRKEEPMQACRGNHQGRNALRYCALSHTLVSLSFSQLHHLSYDLISSSRPCTRAVLIVRSSQYAGSSLATSLNLFQDVSGGMEIPHVGECLGLSQSRRGLAKTQ